MMGRKVLLIVLAGALAAGLCISSIARAQSVPQLINFQGRLTDAGGAPLSGDTVDMRFAFLDGDTSAATELWVETQMDVLVTDGIYNVLLGT